MVTTYRVECLLLVGRHSCTSWTLRGPVKAKKKLVLHSDRHSSVLGRHGLHVPEQVRLSTPVVEIENQPSCACPITARVYLFVRAVRPLHEKKACAPRAAV